MQKVNLRETIHRIKSRTLRENFKKFIQLNGDSKKIALSVSLGLFVGLVIPMGFQTMVVVPLAFLFDCNIIVAVISTLISNPFTIIPIYLVAIKIGEAVTPYSISLNRLSSFSSNPTFDSFINLGQEGLILIFTGTLIMAIVVSLTSFLLTVLLINKYRRSKGIN